MHSGAAGHLAQATTAWGNSERQKAGIEAMRQVTRKGLISVAAAGGVLALGGGYAHADSGAHGTASHSPGVLSGNNVQVPVHVPVNVCGNTVNVAGLLNPAMGNRCANVSDTAPGGGSHGGSHGGSDDGGYGGGSQGGSHHGSQDGSHGGGSHHAPPYGGGSHAGGGTDSSPGVGSGNSVEVPIDIPVNVCGLGLNIIGVGNPVTGNGCENDSPPAVTPPPHVPVTPSTPPRTPDDRNVPPAPVTPHVPNNPDTQNVSQPVGDDTLASTGAGSLGTVIPVGAGLLLAGSLIYRRTRAAA